jgi:predicted O-methyltransferase YrrM
MQDKSRSLNFRSEEHNRYWWHKNQNIDYIPPIYSFLEDNEWEIIKHWFEDTGRRFTSTGEAGVPLLSLLLGLIMGNGLKRIVQCGHYVGYSSLLIGFMLRRMHAKHGLLSIDIDAEVTTYTQSWLDRAGLTEYVTLRIADSADSRGPPVAQEQFGGKAPQLVFIDSSHQYQHSLEELDLWYPALCKGGIMCLHDTSKYASTFDSSGKGGVFRAVSEWCLVQGIPNLSLNSWVDGGEPGDFPYTDGCGLTMFQKCH